MSRILVMLPATEEHKKMLEAAAPNEEFVYANPKDASVELVHSADIILGNVPPAKIAGSTKLRWLQLDFAGTNGFTDAGVLPEGCILTNATGAYGLAISEYMLGVLLMMMKKLDRYYVNQKNCEWRDEGFVKSIYESKILVVGMGDIGSDFARKAAALGADVYGVRRHKAEAPEYVKAMYTMDEIDSVIGEMDVVTSSLPGYSETMKVFNKERFAKMKEGAYFINVGRGTAVDTDSLVEALNSGHLGGAALDVTDPEPLPSDHPLWKAKNLVLTPHTSGQSHLPETFERIVKLTAKNLANYMAGRELVNVVDFETGYRKL